MSRLSKLERKILEVEAMTKQNRPVSGINVQVNDIPGGGGRSINATVSTGSVSRALGIGPFHFISLDSLGMLRLAPGTVNQLIPDNPLDPIDCSAAGITHVKLACGTASNQVNQAVWVADGTPAVPPLAIKGSPPTDFEVEIAMVENLGGGQFVFYRVWPNGYNVVASPVEWILTDRSMPTPSQTLTEIWYSWDIHAG